ncbi:MAG: glycosyltransferase family 4 protein [Cyclobacteriaceae bacterium]
MKILLITNMRPSPQKPYSGIFVINQFNRLKENPNHQVSLFTMERSFTSGIASYWKYLKAFISFVPHYFKKYDLLHVHYFFPFIIAAYLYKVIRPSTKLVVTFHGSDINEKINEKNAKFFRGLTGKVDFVIAVGNDLAAMVYQKLNLKTDQVLSAGIEDRVFAPFESSEKLYDFTFASSFVYRKGLDILIEAIKIFSEKELRFCFIGGGVLEDEIHSLSEDYKVDIKLNLKQREMCEVFNQSYFHVLPSRFEPFGLVVTESMFCGTPSIVSNVGGIKDQVLNGVNGFVLEENTPACLAKHLEDCYSIIQSGKYLELQKSALASNKEHSLTEVMLETMRIYESLVYPSKVKD